MGQSFARAKYISFQGSPGAFSDLACRTVFPEIETLPCSSFEDAFLAVQNDEAQLAMIPIDNTLAGRVADVHHLLPNSGLKIIGEHFQPIHHCLLAIETAEIEDLEFVHSHVHALPQCRKLIRELKLKPFVYADTAGAAAKVAADGKTNQAAIASSLAAEIYGLKTLRENIQDDETNTTRFIILSKEESLPTREAVDASLVTSFVFDVRNIPAALYKALGGFATNGVNMTKLESYIGSDFQAALFYAEIIGHPEDPLVKLAFEELNFFAKNVEMLGTYPAHPFRNLT
jgi:prephenate dehydratase